MTAAIKKNTRTTSSPSFRHRTIVLMRGAREKILAPGWCGIRRARIDVSTLEEMMMAKRILAPIGARERSETIVPIVAALAQSTGSTVRLLRVFPVPDRVIGQRGQTIAYVDQEMARLTAEGLDDLRRIEAQMDGIAVESVVRFGEPTAEILLEAEAFDADLIALAASNRGRLRRALLPGVAERVARKALVPTLALYDRVRGRRARRTESGRPRGSRPTNS
jgi:nucleotide-binding universal stress UspA family protein